MTIKIWLVFYVISKMQIKTTNKYYLIPLSQSKCKKLNNTEF